MVAGNNKHTTINYTENLFQNVNKNPSYGYVIKLNQARCCYSIENEGKKMGAVASPGVHENVRKRELLMTVSALILRDALNLTSSARLSLIFSAFLYSLRKAVEGGGGVRGVLQC